MEQTLSIRELRRDLGLTLEEFAERIGVASRGYVSTIERGGPCSVRVALAIEVLSDGRISAATLNADVALVEAARGLGDSIEATSAAADGAASSGNSDKISSAMERAA